MTVSLEGFAIATTTDVNGNFSMKISKNVRNVVFSFIGYKKVIRRFTGDNGIFRCVIMHPDSIDIDNVVLTSIYRRKKVLRVLPLRSRVMD